MTTPAPRVDADEFLTQLRQPVKESTMGDHSGPTDYGKDKPSQDGQKPKPESGKHKKDEGK
jgi:hypothetical protein